MQPDAKHQGDQAAGSRPPDTGRIPSPQHTGGQMRAVAL